jgi:hypothetical protein
MTKLIFIALTLGLAFNIKAQNRIDNYSFMKLYVTNDKGEVLLVGDENSFEITGARYNDTLTVKKFVDWMGNRMGIKINNIRLRGLITFHYAWKSNPTLMQYFTAQYESGALILPEGCVQIRWVKKSETAKLIPYDEMNKIIAKINECEYLFGGSFRIEKDSITHERKSKFLEPFYRLN